MTHYLLSDKRRLVFILLIIGLQIADVMTTNYALRIPTDWEANPIMAFFQAHLAGWWWLPKLLVITPILVFIATRYWRAAVAIVLLCSLVDLSNLFSFLG